MKGGCGKFIRGFSSAPLCIERALKPRRTAALRCLTLNVEPLNQFVVGGSMADYPLTAAAISSEIKRAGIHFVVALPDRVTSQHLLKGMLSVGDFHVVQVCKVDEGVSICSGLLAAG